MKIKKLLALVAAMSAFTAHADIPEFESNSYVLWDPAIIELNVFEIMFYTETAIDKDSDPKNLVQFDDTANLNTIRLGPCTGLLTDEVITIMGSASNKRTGVTDIEICPGAHSIMCVWDATSTYYDIYLDGVEMTTVDSSGGDAPKITSERVMLGKSTSNVAPPESVMWLKVFDATADDHPVLHMFTFPDGEFDQSSEGPWSGVGDWRDIWDTDDEADAVTMGDNPVEFGAQSPAGSINLHLAWKSPQTAWALAHISPFPWVRQAHSPGIRVKVKMGTILDGAVIDEDPADPEHYYEYVATNKRGPSNHIGVDFADDDDWYFQVKYEKFDAVDKEWDDVSGHEVYEDRDGNPPPVIGPISVTASGGYNNGELLILCAGHWFEHYDAGTHAKHYSEGHLWMIDQTLVAEVEKQTWTNNWMRGNAWPFSFVYENMVVLERADESNAYGDHELNSMHRLEPDDWDTGDPGMGIFMPSQDIFSFNGSDFLKWRYRFTMVSEGVWSIEAPDA
jgi:hypothetical protein